MNRFVNDNQFLSLTLPAEFGEDLAKHFVHRGQLHVVGSLAETINPTGPSTSLPEPGSVVLPSQRSWHVFDIVQLEDLRSCIQGYIPHPCLQFR